MKPERLRNDNNQRPFYTKIADQKTSDRMSANGRDKMLPDLGNGIRKIFFFTILGIIQE
jgi:hypothetical protein